MCKRPGAAWRAGGRRNHCQHCIDPFLQARHAFNAATGAEVALPVPLVMERQVVEACIHGDGL